MIFLGGSGMIRVFFSKDMMIARQKVWVSFFFDELCFFHFFCLTTFIPPGK